MPDRADFGRMLREARERRGVPLRELANATKISLRVLEELERNDISHLPGGIFGRGVVRAYAAGVGLDPETAIQAFLAQFPHESVTAGHPTSRNDEDFEAIDSTRQAATTFVRLAAISALVLAVLVYLMVVGRPPATGSGDGGTVDAAAQSSAGNGAVTPPAADIALTRGTVDRLTVVVSASRPCMVSATVDGDRAIDDRFAAGDARTLDVRHDLELTASDGAAITMTINGEMARPLGLPGESVSVRFDLSNFQAYLIPR